MKFDINVDRPTRASDANAGGAPSDLEQFFTEWFDLARSVCTKAGVPIDHRDEVAVDVMIEFHASGALDDYDPHRRFRGADGVERSARFSTYFSHYASKAVRKHRNKLLKRMSHEVSANASLGTDDGTALVLEDTLADDDVATDPTQVVDHIGGAQRIAAMLDALDGFEERGVVWVRHHGDIVRRMARMVLVDNATSDRPRRHEIAIDRTTLAREYEVSTSAVGTAIADIRDALEAVGVSLDTLEADTPTGQGALKTRCARAWARYRATGDELAKIEAFKLAKRLVGG